MKTPNYIYIQTSAGTDIELCWNLFKQTAAMFPVYLALGKFMVTCNPEAEPRSGAAACGTFDNRSICSMNSKPPFVTMATLGFWHARTPHS